MSTRKSLLFAAFFTLLFCGGIACFNYVMDPLCYYCNSFSLDKTTLNRYYLTAQLVLANPDAEQIILGSSRGETTSPLWIQKVSKLKTLNLSASGSEMITKKALLSLALEKTKLKRVIWMADYFELILANADVKIKNTPAFRKYVADLLPPDGVQSRLHELQQLIDHNTLEASFVALHRRAAVNLGQGAGEQIDYSACEKPDFPTQETAYSLSQKVDLFYQEYVEGPIRPPQDVEAWQHFEALIKGLQKRNVAVLIVIPPYHPAFMKRLKIEYPQIYAAHLKWVAQVKSLQGPGIEVVNDFDGIPHDDGSQNYWNDGVHFTCKSVMQMFANAL